MTYTVRHIGTVTVQAESEAALEAMLQHFGYWAPLSCCIPMQPLDIICNQETSMPDDITRACKLLQSQAMLAKPSEYDADEQFMLDNFSLRVGLEEARQVIRDALNILSDAPRPPREFVTDEVE